MAMLDFGTAMWLVMLVKWWLLLNYWTCLQRLLSCVTFFLTTSVWTLLYLGLFGWDFHWVEWDLCYSHRSVSKHNFLVVKNLKFCIILDAHMLHCTSTIVCNMSIFLLIYYCVMYFLRCVVSKVVVAKHEFEPSHLQCCYYWWWWAGMQFCRVWLLT